MKAKKHKGNTNNWWERNTKETQTNEIEKTKETQINEGKGRERKHKQMKAKEQINQGKGTQRKYKQIKAKEHKENKQMEGNEHERNTNK